MTKKKRDTQKRKQEALARNGRSILAEQQDLHDCEQKLVTAYELNPNRSLAVSTWNGHDTTAVMAAEVGVESVLIDHPTHQNSLFFPSCDGFEVSGGHFSSYRDHHSTGNVFINVTRPSSDESVEVHRSAPGVRRNRKLHDSPVSRSSEQYDGGRNFSHGREILEPQSPVVVPSPTISRATGHSAPAAPPLTVQKSSEIYYRHLLMAGRGSPLWIPDPSSTLSLEYQREGIGVGDVIILTDSGGTDFMFNVYHPKQDSAHPINPPEMPEGYYPLERPRSLDMTSHVEFKNNSFLTSSFVNSRRDQEFSGLIFESSAMDGAILTMPNGANSTDLQSKTMVRKYARNNAVQWYKYANEVRGRDVRNGDLRLVVGKTSTTTWGMATFAECTNSQSAFSLKFKPSGNGAGGTSPATYGWECSLAGMATTKSGPDSHEIERLRDNDVDGGDSDQLKVYENQCLFVRTINVMLQDDVWDKLMSEWKTQGLVEDEGPSSGPKPGSGLGSGGSTISSGASGSQSSSGSSGMSSVGNQLGTRATQAGIDGKSRGNLMSLTNKGAVLPPAPQGTHQRSSVHLSSFPPPLGLHPSKIINRFLLRERPQAKMAITEDQDWISVLDENDKSFPEPDILISRMMSMYEFNDETDAVFLKIRDIPDVPTISRPLVMSPHFGHTSEARLESSVGSKLRPSRSASSMTRRPVLASGLQGAAPPQPTSNARPASIKDTNGISSVSLPTTSPFEQSPVPSLSPIPSSNHLRLRSSSPILITDTATLAKHTPSLSEPVTSPVEDSNSSSFLFSQTFSGRHTPVLSLSPRPPDTVSVEVVEKFKKETARLALQVKGLLEVNQLTGQNKIRDFNEALKSENDQLKAEKMEMVREVSEVLSASDMCGSQDQQAVNRLTAELANKEVQYENAKRMLAVITRNEEEMRGTLRESQQATAKAKSEVEDLKRMIAAQDKQITELKSSLTDMGNAMSESTSSTNNRELRVLITDVTKENDSLKSQVRDMQKAMEQLLLSSKFHAKYDEVERENKRLKERVRELGLITAAHVQSPFSGSRVAENLTQENEQPKVQLRDGHRTMAEVRSSNEAKLVEMQQQIDSLNHENNRLKIDLSREENAPPPVYDDDDGFSSRDSP